jgi:hypothetical protein
LRFNGAFTWRAWWREHLLLIVVVTTFMASGRGTTAPASPGVPPGQAEGFTPLAADVARPLLRSLPDIPLVQSKLHPRGSVVILRVPVLETGAVGGVTVVRGLDSVVDNQVLELYRHAVFQPARRGGRPVAATIISIVSL